jgi:sigma-B regulation protein RsbU (phosphoserine phosphatase)
VKDTAYLLAFLVIAGVLLIVGRDQLPSSTVLTWGITFGATSAFAVLLVSLYRVQHELKRSRRELARKEAELTFAREVQAALFPRSFPSDRGLSFSAICIPAQGISGDYYDIVECPDGRIAVALADISGKGVSAAILMANVQARFRALIETQDSLPEVCSRLNDHICGFTQSGKYATFFVAQWRRGSLQMEYVNAGHQVPIVLGPGVAWPDKGGPPLGLFSGVKYEAGTLALRNGDAIVLYSDGIIEAPDDEDEEFGMERLQALLEPMHGRPLREIQKSVLEAVNHWTQRDPNDDMTLFVIRIDDEKRLTSLAREETPQIAFDRLAGEGQREAGASEEIDG